MIHLETIRNHDRFLVVSPEFFSTYWIDSRYKPTGTRSVFPIHIAHVYRNQTKFRHPKLEDHPVVIPGGGPMVITNGGTTKNQQLEPFLDILWQFLHGWFSHRNHRNALKMGIFQACLMTLRLMTWRLLLGQRFWDIPWGCCRLTRVAAQWIVGLEALPGQFFNESGSMSQRVAGWLRCLGLGLGCQLCLLKPFHCLDIS